MKREIKYPEWVMNNACTSLMFCGSASGELSTLCVVCKAQHISEKWIGGSLEGACYSCIFLEGHMEEILHEQKTA